MSSENLLSRLAGVNPDGELAAALAGRADILALTGATEQAVLRPREPGGLSYTLRLALACRIALLQQQTDLAALYQQQLSGETDSAALAMADPAFHGTGEGRWDTLLGHVDRVSCVPREASAADIAALQQAGWSDADIVRLSELIAFMSYQTRVLAGLRLLETQA